MAADILPDTAPEPVYRSAWQRWVAFWFPAADPTTLGFVRISTGLLVLYIHLAYSVDLQQFFGKQGWYSAAFVERERHEYPSVTSPLWDWDLQSVVPARLPDPPHRRQAVVAFIRSLPADEAQRRSALRFLDRVAQYDSKAAKYMNADTAFLALQWLLAMGPAEDVRDRYLDVLVAGPSENVSRDAAYYANNTPAVLLGFAPSERQLVADEVRALWPVLPADPVARKYLLEHLIEVTPEVRRSFVDFLLTLPANADERATRIDYLNRWNQEPERAVRTGNTIFSVWFHVTDPTQMAVIHVAVLGAIVLFTLGLFTRVTSVLVWIAVVGYIHRTQQVLFGMDTMMNILLFYLMIGNCGAALSLDRLIARYRAARASLRRTGALDAPTRAFLACPPPSKSAGFALRLIHVHFCFIYMAAGLSKLKGGAWWDGRATWDVLANPEFTLLQYEWYEQALRRFVEIKPLYHLMISGGAWSTLFIEIAGPFLLWTRLRWLIVLLASAMHAGIAVLMGLNLFELLMMVMLVAFLPDGVIRDRFRGAGELVKRTFAFSPASAPSARAAALVIAVDTDGQVELVGESALKSPAVSGPDGAKLTGPAGVTALFRSVRLLSAVSFVLWVPGVKGALARWLFPSPPAPPAPTPPPVAAPKPPAPAAAS
ncbi:hypothetical protein [Frigoriglobus tundricola]|uniref:HTTM-like domain-containing protein n=1 Tax=Frigoriglobus tundricola TaxID=2774151 RepID=A0A6M5YTK7_9BACT|nr:hypothetical protein [Frigoriglobus tundricola]QJW97405.1 hypothetical protein FTUN_4979 [Frigoriglobus tundricola]